MASEGVVSLSDTSVEVKERKDFKNNPVRRLRLKTGSMARIHFMSTDVMHRLRHYNPAQKRYYRCLQHEGFCPVCLKASSDKQFSSLRAHDIFGANILVYETNMDGSLTNPDNPSADIYFWNFGADKFVALRNIMKEWGDLTGLDLLVSCTDEKFQKVTFSPARKCLYLELGQVFKDAADKKYKEDSYPLDKFLCKEVNLATMCELFDVDKNMLPQNVIQTMSSQPIAQDAAKKSVQTQQAVPPQYVDTSAAKKEEQSFKSLDDIGELL